MFLFFCLLVTQQTVLLAHIQTKDMEPYSMMHPSPARVCPLTRLSPPIQETCLLKSLCCCNLWRARPPAGGRLTPLYAKSPTKSKSKLFLWTQSKGAEQGHVRTPQDNISQVKPSVACCDLYTPRDMSHISLRSRDFERQYPLRLHPRFSAAAHHS